MIILYELYLPKNGDLFMLIIVGLLGFILLLMRLSESGLANKNPAKAKLRSDCGRQKLKSKV